MPGINLRVSKMVADLGERNDAVLLLQKRQEWFQVSLVVLIEISFDRFEHSIVSTRPVLAAFASTSR